MILDPSNVVWLFDDRYTYTYRRTVSIWAEVTSVTKLVKKTKRKRLLRRRNRRVIHASVWRPMLQSWEKSNVSVCWCKPECSRWWMIIVVLVFPTRWQTVEKSTNIEISCRKEDFWRKVISFFFFFSSTNYSLYITYLFDFHSKKCFVFSTTTIVQLTCTLTNLCFFFFLFFPVCVFVVLFLIRFFINEFILIFGFGDMSFRHWVSFFWFFLVNLFLNMISHNMFDFDWSLILLLNRHVMSIDTFWIYKVIYIYINHKNAKA